MLMDERGCGKNRIPFRGPRALHVRGRCATIRASPKGASNRDRQNASRGMLTARQARRSRAEQARRSRAEEDPLMTKQERTAQLVAGALFFSLFFLWGAGYNCFPIFLPSMLTEFHLTRLQVGLVPGVQAITAGVFGLLVGWLLDRVPAQIVMAVGAVLTAVGIVMMSQAGSLHGVLAGSVGTGIGMVASTILPASMVIANWFGERRGTALGITLAGMELGGMVITMMAGYLIVAYGWRFAYAVLAIPLVVVVAPLYLIFVRTRPEQVAQCESAGNPGLAES